MSQAPIPTGMPPLDFFGTVSGLASGGPSAARSGSVFDRSRNLTGETSFGGINVGSPSGINPTVLIIGGVAAVALFVLFGKK